ncbi:MAG: hypothetical protein FGM40_05185 [Rhodocyclaceae bacterium]|nr:hypothetical protein [Rhodocyclaceae bacterium]
MAISSTRSRSPRPRPSWHGSRSTACSRCPEVRGRAAVFKTALVLVVAGCGSLPVFSADAPAAAPGATSSRSAGPQVGQQPATRLPAEASVQREANMLYVNAVVTAPAPAEACFAVLTDYEKLPGFVPGMRSSRIVSQPGEMLRVEQVGVSGLGVFGITVRTVLGLTLTPPRPDLEGRIDFGSYGGNLRQMYGAWVVRDEKAGCRIDYRATIEPDFPVPALIGPFLMRRQITGQLDAIAREIERRQALPAETAPPAIPP